MSPPARGLLPVLLLLSACGVTEPDLSIPLQVQAGPGSQALGIERYTVDRRGLPEVSLVHADTAATVDAMQLELRGVAGEDQRVVVDARLTGSVPSLTTGDTTVKRNQLVAAVVEDLDRSGSSLLPTAVSADTGTTRDALSCLPGYSCGGYTCCRLSCGAGICFREKGNYLCGQPGAFLCTW